MHTYKYIYIYNCVSVETRAGFVSVEMLINSVFDSGVWFLCVETQVSISSLKPRRGFKSFQTCLAFSCPMKRGLISYPLKRYDFDFI